MRVIAGSAKGTRLAAPEGRESRPVLDRVKESWFASLTGRLGGARVLDLYAGVGSLGLEALSRGASSCVFVEHDRDCVELLEQHLARAGLSERAAVRRCAAELAVPDLAAAGDRFDLIFVDPPFAESARPDYVASDLAFARLGEVSAEGALVMLRRECEKKPRRMRVQRRAAGEKAQESGDPTAPAVGEHDLRCGQTPPVEAHDLRCGQAPPGLVFTKSRRWGRSEVLFFLRPATDSIGG